MTDRPDRPTPGRRPRPTDRPADPTAPTGTDGPPTGTDGPPTVKRRPRTPGRDRARSYKCPDWPYDAALEAAHKRGFTLASYIVAKLEELAAEDE